MTHNDLADFTYSLAFDLDTIGDEKAKKAKRGKRYKTIEHEAAKELRRLKRAHYRAHRLFKYYRLAFWLFLAAYITGFLLAMM